MKRIYTIVVLLLSFPFLIGCASSSSSPDFFKGLNAYDQGDYATAVKEWEPLAKKGNVDAQMNLGLLYLEGRGVDQNYKTAVKWIKLAAEQGYLSAQFNLGYAYATGQGIEQDYNAALNWYLLAAERGHKGAQNNLGFAYAKGEGSPSDLPRAYMWWSFAAQKGMKNAAENRDLAVQRMTVTELEIANTMVSACFEKFYKGC